MLCYFDFIHTDADELKGSVREQLLKLAFHICHHLPAGPGSRHTARGKVTHVSLGCAGGVKLLQRCGLDPVRWVLWDRESQAQRATLSLEIHTVSFSVLFMTI